MEALEASTAYQAASLDERLYDEDGSGATLMDMLGSEDDGFELVEDRSAAHSAMRALDDRARRIVEMRFIAGMTQSQIGAELGVSQMHVSRLLRRALADAARDSGCGRLRIAIALKRPGPFPWRHTRGSSTRSSASIGSGCSKTSP